MSAMLHMGHLMLLVVVVSSLHLAHGELPASEPPKSPCPDGWSYCPAASRCYKLTGGAFTQPEATSLCRAHGGNLATIDSAAATQCLLDYAGKSSQEASSAWIGLVDTSENSKHTANCTCWKWLDGGSFDYENFAPGQPNNAEAKEWCTEVFLPGSNYPPGTWNDELCEAYKRPAVCSVPAVPTPSTPSAVTSTVITTEPPCGPPQQTGEPSPATGSPPSPTKATSPSASTTEPACPCELGSTPAGTTRPRTTRASPIPSKASKPSRPPHSSPRASPKPRGRTRATTKAAKHTTATRTLPCPSGWVHCLKASKCYKLVNEGLTQPQAQQRCRKLGGNLASIASAASTKCLIDYVTKTKQKAQAVWLGLVDSKRNVNHTASCTCWKWLDGTPYKYQNFAPGEPKNARKTEWCTAIFLPRSTMPVGTWNDLRCETHTRPALCSMPSKPVARPTPNGNRKPSTPRARRTPAGTAKPPTRRASAKPARTPKPATRRVSPKKGRPTPRNPSTSKPTKRATARPKPAKQACQKSTNAVPLYRAYHVGVQNHFYTTKPDELATAKKNYNYTDEGITGRILRAKAPATTELYRLYRRERRHHFYTTNKEERDNAISKLGYKDHGVVGYVYKATNGKCPCPEVRPLYRMHNSGVVDYFYTMDAGEKARAISKLGYSDQGIMACIYPAK